MAGALAVQRQALRRTHRRRSGAADDQAVAQVQVQPLGGPQGHRRARRVVLRRQDRDVVPVGGHDRVGARVAGRRRVQRRVEAEDQRRGVEVVAHPPDRGDPGAVAGGGQHQRRDRRLARAKPGGAA